MKKIILLFLYFSNSLSAQECSLSGFVFADGQPLSYATLLIKEINKGTITDEDGHYHFEKLSPGKYTLIASFVGFEARERQIRLPLKSLSGVDFSLQPNSLEQVVVTGTLKEVKRLESPVPVEVYSPAFFKKNPTPNIFDALQNVNGVRPQLNCNVCNTGDIHINGLEGPYTMVLIDGMPIVSSLATVYGLSGIPNSLIERIEIVKGPASSLYGSEAVGGLINIITKNPQNAPLLTADVMATSWQEYNVDLGLKLDAGKKARVLTGINYFNFDKVTDYNHDHFTDVTLQERISVFQKWSFVRKDNRLFSLAGRFFYEDRWGGDIDWTKAYRGGNEIYGESIYTRRWELLGTYQLPTIEKLLFSFSYNDHDQNSVYGEVPFNARQRIGFGQLTWDKKIKNHDLLAGAALRYNYYDDNTPTTASANTDFPENRPDIGWLPGLFVQDELTISTKHKVLLGMRYDHNQVHGHIFTPRLAYKWNFNDHIIRLNAGTGFRVVNLFTEDHAALTGAREIIVTEELRPERSWNVNLNYIKKVYTRNGGFISFDASAWYTHFSNVIFPDYETNANQIIYDNLKGHAVTTGLSANVDIALPNGLKILAGATLMDVASFENGIKERQILTERFTGTWAVSYTIPALKVSIDYTGNLYGPMRLPLLGELDPRQPYSPVWSIQNIQLSYKGFRQLEIYGGIKNLLDWTPTKGNPFIIARTDDPFDRNVQFDNQGQPIATPDNPYALTFDPTYVYGPNQGIRGFLGVRLKIR